jgi:hypothetical protein
VQRAKKGRYPEFYSWLYYTPQIEEKGDLGRKTPSYFNCLVFLILFLLDNSESLLPPDAHIAIPKCGLGLRGIQFVAGIRIFPAGIQI